MEDFRANDVWVPSWKISGDFAGSKSFPWSKMIWLMVIPPIMGILLVDIYIYIYIYGRWFQLKNMKVSWDYYSKYMGKTCSKKNAHICMYIYIYTSSWILLMDWWLSPKSGVNNPTFAAHLRTRDGYRGRIPPPATCAHQWRQSTK